MIMRPAGSVYLKNKSFTLKHSKVFKVNVNIQTKLGLPFETPLLQDPYYHLNLVERQSGQGESLIVCLMS